MKRPDDLPRPPVRLTDDPEAPAALAAAVRAARGPAPDPERLASLGAALGLSAPPVFVPPPVAPPAAGAVAAAAGAKAALTGIAAIGAAAAVAVVGFGVGRTKAPAPGRPIPAVVEKVQARAPEPREEIVLPIEAPLAPAPAVEPAPRRRHHTRPAPAAPVAEAPVAPAETPADVASRLREEAALVQRAERLLDTDPAGALRLTDDRRRRFPTGALDQEAEVVAIDALLRLGRRTDAAARALTFDAVHAGSVHARRIKRLMGN